MYPFSSKPGRVALVKKSDNHSRRFKGNAGDIGCPKHTVDSEWSGKEEGGPEGRRAGVLQVRGERRGIWQAETRSWKGKFILPLCRGQWRGDGYLRFKRMKLAFQKAHYPD